MQQSNQRFVRSIRVDRDTELKVTAGDVFRFDNDRKDCIWRNHCYIKVGVMKNPQQVVEQANNFSDYLMKMAISFYRGYKMPKSPAIFASKERLEKKVANKIWDYYYNNNC